MSRPPVFLLIAFLAVACDAEAPVTDSSRLDALQSQLPQIEAGEGRSLSMQALYQFVALGITIVGAIVTGLLTGYSPIYLLVIT